MMYRRSIPVFCLMLALSLVSCSGESNENASTDTTSSMICLVDALGDTVRLDRPPERIVSLAPSLTEMAFALGAGSKLVGATDYCNYPPEALNVPRVSGYSTINTETVIASRPDLILAARGNFLEDLQAMRRMGVAVYAFRVDSIPQIIQETRNMGILLGRRQAADSLIAIWQRKLVEIDRVVSSIPSDQRPRVFFGGLEEPIWSAGPGSYIDNLIKRAGGRNALGSDVAAWPRVDLETLVRLNPDILLTSPHHTTTRSEVLARLNASTGWNTLAAVQNGSIIICGDELLRPGPRLVGVLEELARTFHPEAFNTRHEQP